MLTLRQEKLHSYIEDREKVSLLELFKLFPEVSSMTIRRDLEQLEKEGKIQRFRGGAKILRIKTSLKEAAYRQRMDEHISHKQGIASKALSLLGGARSIYIDAGTTCLQLAKLLPDESFFILSPAPLVALELINSRNIKVNLTGGQLKKDTLALSGNNALAYVRSINIDIAFIGASACSLNSGFTCGDYQDAELKRLIIKKAQKVICLMDASKINYNMPYTFADFRDFDYLVCDQALPKSFEQKLEKSRTKLIY